MSTPRHPPALPAEDQMQALVDRITPTDARIDYVTDLLKPMLAIGEPDDRNAFYAAGRLLGCAPACARRIVRMVARRGSAAAEQVWRATGPGVMPPLIVPDLPPNSVGFVYFAKPATSPNVVKIGFSTNLARRVKDLHAETGEEHRIDAWFVGTPIDEAIAQFAHSKKRITGDWFFVDAEGQIPGFLPVGELAMRRMLGSDLRRPVQ
ncbi:GIY-YIG nuclease family protein [Xanthobacter sp. DSM 24535]|uniref:GIY-YIG nuclease family protein n=1 Tax=Roseixanthobacter psychrophilus TaxID=3119917 RepID=UPI00372C172F